jgi:hypothetical protein
VFPTEFPGYTKTTTTMLKMTKLIYGKGKVVVGDSGFCVREEVVECHKRGLWFHVDDMELGHCETLVAEHDNVPFFIHCCRDLKYVSKIKSTHGMLEMVQDHPTWWKIDGQLKSFKYTEPFSQYSKAKHWVDNVNTVAMIPLVWRRFGGLSGGQCGSSRSYVRSLR